MSHTSSTRNAALEEVEINGVQNDNRTNDSRAVLTIGIRDSGVGGLTVARCIREAFPHARILYFADTIHVPYGGRAAGQIRHFALSIADFLVSQGAQIVVFACNSSSAVALEAARETLAVPIVGTIEPGARAAVAQTQNNRVGVLATQATVESAVYSQHIGALNSEIRVLEIACPRFVPLVETEKTESESAREAAREYLRPLVDFGVDTIVLGCTHYPLLLPVLQRAARELSAPNLQFVDPAQAVAAAVQQNVVDLNVHRGSDFSTPTHVEDDVFFVSGESDGVRHWIQSLLKVGEPNIQKGPVF